jgi:hypothetical protein
MLLTDMVTMLSILGFIPLLGPILQGVGGIVSSFTNLGAVKLQTASATTIAETQASVAIIQTTEDDILLRIVRDIMILPGAVWFALGGWDTIVAKNWPDYRFLVSEFPPQLAYYPYAVLVFLLGNIGVNAWKNR